MKQRSLILFLLLMSFSIGASGSTKNIIGCGTVTVSHDACDALKIDVKVKPDPGFTTCLDWITVTNQTTGGQYSISKSGNNAVDPAVTNPETYHYGSERTITLYVAKPDATDMSLPEPAADNVVITVCFKGGLKLQSNLENATVTWYDGGNAVPEADKAYPEITGASPYVSQFNTTDNTYATGDHYVIAHIVPDNDLSTGFYWTDASLLRSMEARSMETGISTAAGTRGIGTDSYRNLTLLKADEYDSGEGVMKPRHDGAGWYYYKIPKDNFFDTGYTISVLEGEVVPQFDLTGDNVSLKDKTLTVTDGKTNGWSAELTYDQLSFDFDGSGHCPKTTKIVVKKAGTTKFEFTDPTAIAAQITDGYDPAPLAIGDHHTICSRQADLYGWFFGQDNNSKFSINVPFPGKGTKEEPWLIQGGEKLVLLAKCVNIGQCCFEEKFLKLDPSESYSYDMSKVSGFEPIGMSSSYPFCGSFDGKGVTISNLSYSYSPSAAVITDDKSSIGLFGQLGTSQGGSSERKTAVVTNVTLSNCQMSTSDAEICYVGGLAGNVDCGTVSGCLVTGSGEGASSVIAAMKSGSYVGALFGKVGSNSVTLKNNYYSKNVSVANSENYTTPLGGFGKRGYWNGSAFADITTNDGAMLWVKKASIGTITKPTDSKAGVEFIQKTPGEDCYAITDDGIYYAVGQGVTLLVTPDIRTTGILTFQDELTALSMSDGTTNTDINIETPFFTMPESDVTVSATFKQSDWFTIQTNGKEWMSFFQNLGNYIVSAISSGASGLELLTISDIDFGKGIATLKDLGGICFQGVPMLFYCKGGLPTQLLCSPVTGKTAPQFDPQFKGGVSDLSEFAGLSVYVLFGSELVKVDLSDSKLFDIYKAFVVAASTKSATRLTLVRDGATAIDLVTTSDEGEGKWFDLQGRQLDGKPSKKGLYIRNGKKMIIK